jgi:oligoendopeptidase F
MVTLYTNHWRATMYWDFERQIYNKLWNGEAVTVQTLNNTFEKLFKEYYWPNLVYDDYLNIEWAIKHHFFRSYYTHEYAISISAANKVASNIYNEKPWYTDKYLEYLKVWSSELPNDALKKLDIDLTTKDYIEESLESQRVILKEMQSIINEIKK